MGGEEEGSLAGETMLMSIPSIFKSERHGSWSSILSNITETSNGLSRGSPGTTSGRSRSTMVSLLVRLINSHAVFLGNIQRPFLMELCIMVLEFLAQVMTWSSNDPCSFRTCSAGGVGAKGVVAVFVLTLSQILHLICNSLGLSGSFQGGMLTFWVPVDLRIGTGSPHLH